MEKDDATAPSDRRQQSEFLDYRQADVYFIYSFTWDVNHASWRNLCADLNGNEKGWLKPRLHDRAVFDEPPIWANYQPNLVSKRRVLERSQTIQENAKLVLPTRMNVPVTDRNHKRTSFRLCYTLRIFDDGTATFTFHARLNKDTNEDGGAMFAKIHSILHLTRNVDQDSPERRAAAANSPICFATQSYLLIPDAGTRKPNEDWSLFPEEREYCTLHDLFRRLIEHPPRQWAPSNAEILWKDDVLDRGEPLQDFQSPFVLTVTEVTEDSYLSFRKNPTHNRAREVASIMCKLTSANDSILQAHENMSEDFITQILGTNTTSLGLIDYCLDNRLFFSFSKRGAIAITSNRKNLPSCFVIPSFLNLLEIVRARWHMCCILNMKIGNIIDELDGYGLEVEVTDKEGHVRELEAVTKISSTLISLRKAYTRFLRDPIPYLFDGGSITEITKRALNELGVNELSDAIHRNMQVLEAIRNDFEETERAIRRARYDKESRELMAAMEANRAQS